METNRHTNLVEVDFVRKRKKSRGLPHSFLSFGGIDSASDAPVLIAPMASFMSAGMTAGALELGDSIDSKRNLRAVASFLFLLSVVSLSLGVVSLAFAAQGNAGGVSASAISVTGSGTVIAETP